MKTFIKISSSIFIIILWIIFAYNTDNILNFINLRFNWILIFISTLCLIYFFDLIIKKDFKGLKDFLLILLIIFLFISFIPIFSCQTKNLSDGTIVKMNRFNKQIYVKQFNSNLYFIADPSGSVSYRICETNEEKYYVPPNFNDTLYKAYLSIFKNH